MSRMPQVTARELVRFLKAQGFTEDRQAGSHLTLWHAERNVSVTIPVHTGCDPRKDTNGPGAPDSSLGLRYGVRVPWDEEWPGGCEA